MRYGYYPGCSLEGMSAEYDVSLRNLFDWLGIEVEEIPDWICCGTLAAPSVSRLLGLAVPLWNVARAMESRYDHVIAPCSACLYHLKSALHQLHEHPTLGPQIEDILGLPLDGSVKIMHPIELRYQPTWIEWATGAAVVSYGLLVFTLGARFLPLFATSHEPAAQGHA